MILVDTDVMVDLLREYLPALRWLEALGEEEIVLPGFVVMELIQGSNNRAEQERLHRELESYPVVWPAPEVCDEAVSLMARFHLSHRLGMIDALVGQLAVSLNLPLHTFNQKHYAAIADLRLVQPYSKS
jgi:hypothetical protein